MHILSTIVLVVYKCISDAEVYCSACVEEMAQCYDVFIHRDGCGGSTAAPHQGLNQNNA